MNPELGRRPSSTSTRNGRPFMTSREANANNAARSGIDKARYERENERKKRRENFFDRLEGFTEAFPLRQKRMGCCRHFHGQPPGGSCPRYHRDEASCIEPAPLCVSSRTRCHPEIRSRLFKEAAVKILGIEGKLDPDSLIRRVYGCQI